jgi:hypothetical protein
VSVRVDWNRNPVSVHSEDKEELELLVNFLKSKYSIRKRSLVMEDREEGGFLFFLYQPCDPRWVLEFINS